jgi:hypothetical protein
MDKRINIKINGINSDIYILDYLRRNSPLSFFGRISYTIVKLQDEKFNLLKLNKKTK